MIFGNTLAEKVSPEEIAKQIGLMWDGQVKVITGIRRCGKSGGVIPGIFHFICSWSQNAFSTGKSIVAVVHSWCGSVLW